MTFFKKTIDSILADITAKIESLHVVAEAHQVASYVHAEEALLRTKLREEEAALADRARKIAGKFAELVS